MIFTPPDFCLAFLDFFFHLVVFGSLSQIEGGVDFRGALLADGGHLESDWLSQAVAGLQLQLGRLGRDFVEVSGMKRRLKKTPRHL